MYNLGISIYPSEDNLHKIKQYINLAKKYNVSRVFTNFLGLDKTKEKLLEKISEVCLYAKKMQMEVVVDVDPDLYNALNIDVMDLSFFKKMGITTIRLDLGLGGFTEALLSNNDEGISIEINASNPSLYLENILSLQANSKKITASHNFYPQRWTGLDYEFFLKLSKKIKKHNIAISAFVALDNKDTEGPWDVNEKLVTLEMHRDLPLDFQVRHLMATGIVDNIIISTQYASESDFKLLNNIISTNKLSIKVNVEENISSIEKKILFEHSHFVRCDISSYVVRSTIPRITYKNEKIIFKKVNKDFFEVGDITILNDNYGRYKGELQIILQPIPNDGKRNLVAKLLSIENNLLKYLVSYREFKFIT